MLGAHQLEVADDALVVAGRRRSRTCGCRRACALRCRQACSTKPVPRPWYSSVIIDRHVGRLRGRPPAACSARCRCPARPAFPGFSAPQATWLTSSVEGECCQLLFAPRSSTWARKRRRAPAATAGRKPSRSRGASSRRIGRNSTRRPSSSGYSNAASSVGERGWRTRPYRGSPLEVHLVDEIRRVVPAPGGQRLVVDPVVLAPDVERAGVILGWRAGAGR